MKRNPTFIAGLFLFFCLASFTLSPSQVWAMSAECETAIAEREAALELWNTLKEIKEEAGERNRRVRERYNSASQAYEDAQAAADQAWASLREANEYHDSLRDALSPGERTEPRSERLRDANAAARRANSAGRIARELQDVSDRARDYMNNVRDTFDQTSQEYRNAISAARRQFIVFNRAAGRVDEVCGADDFALDPDSVMNDLQEDPVQRYGDHARNANTEDIAIEENQRQSGGGSSSSSTCNIGSGTSCTSVSFSMNEGGGGGAATFSMGGTTLASSLSSSSQTFNGTAASGQTFTLTVTCAGAGCNVDFSALSGASCPTITGQAIAPSGTFTSSCTIN